MGRLETALLRAKQGEGSNEQSRDEAADTALQSPQHVSSTDGSVNQPDQSTLLHGPSRERAESVKGFVAVDGFETRQAPAFVSGPMAPLNGFGGMVAGKLVVMPELPRNLLEQYRRIAAVLYHAQLQRGVKVVMVVSAIPGEGKTLTATNLALTLSESYRWEVLLLDADLRRPMIKEVFGIPNVSGLSEGLRSKVEQKLPLIQVSSHLKVLPAGRPDPDAVGLLSSARMRHILQEAAGRFDWVIIDTPPVAVMPDASLLSTVVDAALLVVWAGKTPHALVQSAVTAFGRDRIIGVVLNRMEEEDNRSEYYRGYYRTPGVSVVETPKSPARAS